MQLPLQRDYWPTNDWKQANPQDMSMDADRLARMHAHLHENVPGLHGLLIVRHGYLVFEEYYQGFHRGSYSSISSATKSVVSQLVGVALAQGLLSRLDQPMLDFFPEYAALEPDPRKHAITLRHLLCLQTGFSTNMPHEYWRDPVQLALERPMERQPGEAFAYDSQGVDILSGTLTKVTGKNAASFADATLFKQLGIWRDPASRFTWQNDPHGAHEWHENAFWDEKDGYLWKVDPQGNNPGGFGAHFTAREMAKLGYLYLNGGYWDGEQIIPADFVADSACEHSAGGWPVFLPYGYLWWLTQHDDKHAFFASGFGGKLIYAIPSLDLVIATITSTEKAIANPQQDKDILALIPNFILPSIFENENQ
jgi:CubicO group peptidase (beta-lactamase class C family)